MFSLSGGDKSHEQRVCEERDCHRASLFGEDPLHGTQRETERFFSTVLQVILVKSSIKNINIGAVVQ